jgi:hypothetical protein
MPPLLSQIIRLAKSILLRPKDPSRHPSAQFSAGRHSPFRFPSGVGLSWWYSDDTFKAIEAVAGLMIESSTDFRDCDSDTVESIVPNTLQEICLDSAIFDSDAVFLARQDNLFECRKVSALAFAERIQEAIASNLRASIGRRCTIYVVPRFWVDSFVVEGESIRLIARNDETAWQSLVSEGYEFDGWTPLRPQVGFDRNRTFVPPHDFECLFIAEEIGTQKGTRFSSILRFRKLAAVLHAVACEHLARPIHKAAASAFTFCAQFPHNSNQEAHITRSDCDPVMPYFTSHVRLPAPCVTSIRDWYAATRRCDLPHRNRIEKAANFLNRGLNSGDIEAYINYFVTLDALFGQRGSVETSILEGVKELHLDPSHLEKVAWLFELRNEIVHGGSRYISEWRQYVRYMQHFGSKPTADVQRLAQLAVLGAPRLFAQ